MARAEFMDLFDPLPFKVADYLRNHTKTFQKHLLELRTISLMKFLFFSEV